VEGKGVGLPRPSDAGPDDEIRLPSGDRLHEERKLLRVVAIVRIEEDHDLGGWGGAPEVSDASEAGRTVTAPRLEDDRGAEPAGRRSRAVHRAVVHHDDLAEKSPR